MSVFFDVGANNGHWSLKTARANPKSIVYAFEPTPRMCDIIELESANLTNYRLVRAAVSDFEGRCQFKISGHADWGCSSLLDFSPKSKTEWPGRTDFSVTETVDVEVIRLDSFIKNEPIQEIEYLHVDTQGSDLKVLIGMGDCIRMVKKGVIEAAAKEDVLYLGQNTKEECMDFLNGAGFEILHIWNNDPHGNEVNIEFIRSN
jgi:FkbM family methyltransferase